MTGDLPFGLTVDDMIVLMAALAAVLTVMAVWSALVPRDTLTARARALVERRAALKAAALAPKRRSHRLRAVGLMRAVVTRLNLMRNRQSARKTLLLARAGFRSGDAAIGYVFAKAALPVVCGAVAAVLLFGIEVYGGSQTMRILLTLAAALAGSYLPDLYIRNCAEKRREKLTRGLPDALDLMVICAEAGLSLDAAMLRVSRELGPSWPELADEFGLTSVELGFLPDRRQALDNLGNRSDLPGLRAMVNTLSQTERYGTPLAQSLRVLAAELRNERMMKAEEKAARLPATLTVPMILFILPPLFIVLIGPAILSVADGFASL